MLELAAHILDIAENSVRAGAGLVEIIITSDEAKNYFAIEINDDGCGMSPEEIKKAQQILAQRDRILAQSQEEANRTLSLAREKADQLVERDAIIQAAHIKAEQIIKQSTSDIGLTKREADDYVLETLSRLEAELERILNQVRNGISAVQAENAQQTVTPEKN